MILQCIKCGYQKEILNDFLDDFICPLCEGNMIEKTEPKIIDDEGNKIADLKDSVDIYIIKSMKINIEKLGNNETWRIIEENFREPKTRLIYRKYFFMAGGTCPEKEIK